MFPSFPNLVRRERPNIKRKECLILFPPIVSWRVANAGKYRILCTNSTTIDKRDDHWPRERGGSGDGGTVIWLVLLRMSSPSLNGVRACNRTMYNFPNLLKQKGKIMVLSNWWKIKIFRYEHSFTRLVYNDKYVH